MKLRKRTVVAALVLGGTTWLLVSLLTDPRSADDRRFDRLTSLRCREVRFMRWRSKPWYRSLSKLSGFDPLAHYAHEADVLEASLQKSGYLIGVQHYRPSFVVPAVGLRARELLVRPGEAPFYVPAAKAKVQYARLWDFSDSIWLVCRKRDAAYWQQVFCAITNRVRWGKLRKLSVNNENVDCYLPDGEMVDLGACQDWLNESVAAGWMVGVCGSNGVLIASRRRPGTD